MVWNTLFPAENIDPWSSGQSRNPRPVPIRTEAPYGCPLSSTWKAPSLHTMLAWSDSPMQESFGMLMSLQAPLPTVAPYSLSMVKLEASFPSATVVNLRIICESEPGAEGAALTGGPADETFRGRGRGWGTDGSKEVEMTTPTGQDDELEGWERQLLFIWRPKKVRRAVCSTPTHSGPLRFSDVTKEDEWSSAVEHNERGNAAPEK